jgi:predicted O-methyltransferase YrrM
MYLKELIINIIYFYNIPVKIYRKIFFYFSKKNYDEKYYQEEQNKIFHRLNLNRTDGLKKLKEIKKDIKESMMSSEHEVLFSCLSLNNNIKISKILEIGTFDGINSLLMSKIFSNAKIDTIDLSYLDDDFKNFYDRQDKLFEFIEYRNNILKNNNSIKFLEKNSINLINANKKYDLIWIDGGHGYPVVCADIINSLHLINNEGIIICDDIFVNLSLSMSDKMYNSIASYETLSLLKKEKLINLELIYKRLEVSANCLVNERKFIAIFKKIKNDFF